MITGKGSYCLKGRERGTGVAGREQEAGTGCVATGGGAQGVEGQGEAALGGVSAVSGAVFLRRGDFGESGVCGGDVSGEAGVVWGGCAVWPEVSCLRCGI